jgi:1-acyl-sn-glycerol-3-phosphate acyltransferase
MEQQVADDPLAAFAVGRFAQRFASFLLRLGGWRIEGAVHLPPRFVLIAAPHTTNWDGFIMVLAAYAFRIRISWFVKHTWFRWPMSTLMRASGGFPIDRRKSHGVVAQVVERFTRGSEPLIVAVAAEGTRRKMPHWKMGFYHIARGADVPVVLGYVDYGRKVAGLGPAVRTTGDLEADFRVFREFYEKVTPLRPELMGPIIPPPDAVAGDAPSRPA